MSTAALVVVCALEMLGRSAATFPPIRITEHRPPNASANAEAFVNPADQTIVLIGSAPALVSARAALQVHAQCRQSPAFALLASVIVHEEWHLRHGANEDAAYAAQLTTLHSLGFGPESSLYHRVKRAMIVVNGQRARRDR
jgi:hypothetical protein